MADTPTVFVVDDDADIRQSLEMLIRSAGWSVETYSMAEEFLDQYDAERPGCLVLDLQMPGMGGMELLDRLARWTLAVPVIVVTGHGDVSTAVKALHQGAVDFLEKPFARTELLQRVGTSIQQDGRRRARRRWSDELRRRRDELSKGERDVLRMIVDGKSNKEMAAALGLSRRGIDARRANVMRKMEATSVPALVRMVVSLDSEPTLGVWAGAGLAPGYAAPGADAGASAT